MTDDSRPRPLYGEYATPEVQAKAMGFSHPVEPPGPDARVAPLQPVAPPIPRPYAGEDAARHARPVNRVVTLGLLGLGLLNVLASSSGYLNLPVTLQTIYTQLSVGTYTQIALASVLGIVAVVTQAILWLVTAGISLQLLKSGRTAWWVPLTGGVVSVVALVIIMYIAMFNDPALALYLGSHH